MYMRKDASTSATIARGTTSGAKGVEKQRINHPVQNLGHEELYHVDG
jgi:hypothetical protein